MNEYQKFLKSKAIISEAHGIQPKNVNPILFEFQRDIVKWSLRQGLFAEVNV